MSGRTRRDCQLHRPWQSEGRVSRHPHDLPWRLPMVSRGSLWALEVSRTGFRGPSVVPQEPCSTVFQGPCVVPQEPCATVFARWPSNPRHTSKARTNPRLHPLRFRGSAEPPPGHAEISGNCPTPGRPECPGTCRPSVAMGCNQLMSLLPCKNAPAEDCT